MTSPPAFQFYARDFLMDEAVALMTDEECGVYIRLLCHAWLERGIPADLDKLARLTRRSREEFDRVWPALEPKWSVDGTGRLVSGRMERVRERREEYAEGQREHGRKGGRPPNKKGGLPKPLSEKKVCNSSVQSEDADEVLKCFNEIARTRFSSSDYLRMIGKRMDEHSDLSVADHEDIIRRNFAAPWWEGAGSPNVIYGSAAQFERAIHHGPKASKPGPKRSAEAQARIASWSKPGVAA